MEQENLLYIFQHRAIPKWLEISGEQLFLHLAAKEDEAYFELLQTVYKNCGKECPYKLEDCHILKAQYENIYILILKGFEDHQSPLCSFSFIFLNYETKELRYFCTEYDAHPITGDPVHFFCEWDKGKHQNYGSISDVSELQLFCFSISFYLSRFLDLDVEIPIFVDEAETDETEGKVEDTDNISVLECPQCHKKAFVFMDTDKEESDEPDDILYYCPLCEQFTYFRAQHNDSPEEDDEPHIDPSKMN